MWNATIAWLLTYALHSTLFLALAGIVSRRLAQRMPAVEEAVWRFALVAGLVTASLQIAVGFEPLTGSWRLASSAPSVESVATAIPAVERPRAVERRTVEALPAAPRGEAPAPSRAFPVSLPMGVAGVWLAGALFLTSVWTIGLLRLRRRLRPRPQVIGATMVSLLGELQERAGMETPVRLTCSSRLPVPVALGLRRPEICVPPRALASLAPEQQEGMLAHELAHLVRRDPFWLAFGRLLASVLFFQPLNWVAVRRLRELSELLCDEWAVGRTGRPVSLARCLTEVAGWSFPSSRPLGSLPVPGMADRPSNLARRIRRLLEEARSPQRRVHPVWLAAGMVILVVAVVLGAPGVQAAVASGASEAPVRAEASTPLADPGEEALAPEPGDEDMDLDMDLDLDVDLDIDDAMPADLAARIESELDRSLDGIGEETARAAAMADAQLSEEQAEELARRHEEMAERISRQVEERLQPKVKELERLAEEHASHFENSEEMRAFERRAEELAERMRPSEEEMAKLQAEIEKMKIDAGMSAEDRQKIREEARRMAEAHRLSDKDRAEIDEMRRQAHEMAQRSMREHQPEIDRLRREIQEEARAIREEVRRQMENDPQLRALRERHREERERLREEREEKREQMREDRQRTPRPRPERHVQVRIAPDIHVRVEPAVAPVARREVDVRVRPAIAPVAQPAPPGATPAPMVAPVAQPAPPGATPEPMVAPEPPGR